MLNGINHYDKPDKCLVIFSFQYTIFATLFNKGNKNECQPTKQHRYQVKYYT